MLNCLHGFPLNLSKYNWKHVYTIYVYVYTYSSKHQNLITSMFMISVSLGIADTINTSYIFKKTSLTIHSSHFLSIF